MKGRIERAISPASRLDEASRPRPGGSITPTPEYLALEEESPIRHEFRDGEIREIAGGSPDHAALAPAVIGAISAQLPPGCRTFTSDLRVRVPGTRLSTYPDATVVCGRTQRAADDPFAVINPVLLIEVTSPSTEDYDRGEKVRHYKHLPSLKEVLFVSHREPRLTVHRRDETGAWTALEVIAAETLTLENISAHLAVDVVYQGGLEDTGPPRRSGAKRAAKSSTELTRWRVTARGRRWEARTGRVGTNSGCAKRRQQIA